MLWTRAAEGNKNFRVLDPGRGNQYRVRTQLSTLGIHFVSSFLFIYLSLIHSTLSPQVHTPYLGQKRDKGEIEKSVRIREGKVNDNY